MAFIGKKAVIPRASGALLGNTNGKENVKRAERSHSE